MHAGIFMWVGLLLIGSVSIIKCDADSSEDDDEIALDRRRVESSSLDKWSELFQSVRSARFPELFEWSDDSEEQKRETKDSKTACDSECKVGQLSLVSNECTCPVGPTTSPCQTQSSGLCTTDATKYSEPVLLITFGAGSKQYSSATPASLGFTTTYPQLMDSRTYDGSFVIVNEVPQDHAAWLGGGLDHTPSTKGGSTKGYMMLFNVKIASSHVLFSISASNLNIGLRYEFSTYLANLCKYGTNGIQPDIRFEVRTATDDNTLLATGSTGKIPEEKTLTWKQYGMSFITPSSSVVVSVITNVSGGGGNDIAVDDIAFVPCSSINNVVCE